MVSGGFADLDLETGWELVFTALIAPQCSEARSPGSPARSPSQAPSTPQASRAV